MFSDMLLSTTANVETEPEIIAIAEQLREGLSMFRDLSDAEYNDAINLAVATIQVSVGKSYVIEANKHKSWFEAYYKELNGATRWERYKDYLLYKKHFAKKVIQSMQENLFKITDLLGNPKGENFKRKGLIVGDVQSGKTANYVGMMNLATDANYKVIIVLTGTTNTLREQTQLRIEDGLGVSKGNKGVKSIPNAQYEGFIDPVYLTSYEDDFKTSSKKNFQQSIEAANVPIVLVTKKNSTSLKNISVWLKEYSKKYNADHIDASLLLIDDEADFASVNTESGEEPTAINSKIRDILELFTKSSYVGFTATPYANIFIDPADEDDMFGQDLFPRDYIYVLGESEEYVGVQSVFSDDNKVAVNRRMLVALNPEEVDTYLPLKHKKIDIFHRLSPSMKEAINLFLIANVIRDVRNSEQSHRSMLMNISRFKKIHEQIKIVVTDYLDQVKMNVRLYGKLPYGEAIKVPVIGSLKETFEKYYEGNLEEDISFREILPNMNDSIYRIKAGVINADSKDVDYIQNEEGERIIVIGGFALSRGLTLEGLIISYYYRNSVMYDSLLQMGRWFGYRNGYKDLCKIFMTPKVINDFKFISLATQELKDDLDINSKRGLTPMQFGIKVRSGQVGLIITARNKMRTGEQITAQVDFSKDIVETTAINLGENNFNDQNFQMIKKFVAENRKKVVSKIYPTDKNEAYGIRGVDKYRVIEFIKEFVPEKLGSKFDSELIIKWLRENQSDLLNEWDFAFVTGEEKDLKFDYGNGITGSSTVRTLLKASNNPEYKGIYKNGNSRLGSPTDGRYGLSSSQFENFKINFIKKGTISQREYFDQSVGHRPIILVYSVIPKIDGVKKTDLEPIPMISIGIPDLGTGKSNPVQYKVNKVYLDLDELEMEDD